MPLEPVILGYEPAVRINGTPFGVTGGNVELVWDEHEVGDSETGRNKTHKRGRFLLQATLNFYGKNNVNYHEAPLLIGTATDEEIQLWVYNNGIGDDPYKCASFSCFNYKLEWDKTGELKGTLTGKSNGQVLRPGE